MTLRNKISFFLCCLIFIYFSCVPAQNQQTVHSVPTAVKEEFAATKLPHDSLLEDIEDPTETVLYLDVDNHNDNHNDNQLNPLPSSPPEDSKQSAASAVAGSRRFQTFKELYDTRWVKRILDPDQLILTTAGPDWTPLSELFSDLQEGGLLLENNFIKIGLSLPSQPAPMLPAGGFPVDISTPHRQIDELRSLFHAIRINGKRDFALYQQIKKESDKRTITITMQGHLYSTPSIKLTTSYELDHLSPFLKITTSVYNLPANRGEVSLEEQMLCPRGKYYSLDNTFNPIQGTLNDVQKLTTKAHDTVYHYFVKDLSFHTQVDKHKAVLTHTVLKPANNRATFTRFIGVGDTSFSPHLLAKPFGQITGMIHTFDGPLTNTPILIKKLNNQIIALSQSDKEGFFHYHLPPGVYKVAAGAPTTLDKTSQVTLKVNPYSRTVTKLMVNLSKILISIQDSTARNRPFRISILGKNGTITPDLNPINRNFAIKNFLFSSGGEREVYVPPGIYEIHVTSGILFSACSKPIVLSAGNTVKVKCPIKPVFQNHSFKTADLSLFSSQSYLSGVSIEHYYLMAASEGLDFISLPNNSVGTPYIPSPPNFPQAIDGISFLSPKFGFFSLYQVPNLTLDDVLHLKALTLESQLISAFEQHRLNNPQMLIAFLPLLPFSNQLFMPLKPRQQIFTQIDFFGLYHKQQNDITTNTIISKWRALLDQKFDGLPFASSYSNSYESLPGYPRIFFKDEKIVKSHLDNNNANTSTPQDSNNQNTNRQDDGTANAEHASILTKLFYKKNVLLTNGPLIDLTINDFIKPGDSALIQAGGISVKIKVVAANWISLKELRIVLNNKVYRTIPLSPNQQIFNQSLFIPLKQSGWIYAEVIGEEFKVPVLPGLAEQPTPWAITNAIFLERDGDNL